MEWHSLVKRMDAEVHLDVGGATTPDEFDRIALTIAFALSNPCECFLDFHVHMMCLFYKKTRLVGMWNVWQNMSKMCIPKQMVVHPKKMPGLPNVTKIHSLENLKNLPPC